MTTRSLWNWKLSEIVIVLVLAVALGVLWWGWTFVSALTSPLGAIGLNYLVVGFWFTGGTLVPFLVRRPGAALLGEVAAAFIEGFITQWGITAVIWGLVQGAACELVFALFRYRRYSAGVLILAGALAGVFSYILDFFYSRYAGLQLWVIGVQVVSIVVSGALLGGLLAYLIGRGIIRTGVLRTVLPADEENPADDEDE
jgi:energy-coupling factor transport system substrate-specific component